MSLQLFGRRALRSLGSNSRRLPVRWHSEGGHEEGESININWITKDGVKETHPAKIGSNLLRSAQRHEIELEGACEGVCACSTCHVIFDFPVYQSLPEPSEDEEDMLDQAFGLTATSRLGCQVVVTKELDGITVALPMFTRNFYVDGHVPKPH
ncbi:2Fe-2S ferredoxin-type domain-containing protein [Ochromonadaceae sp. CCMP2298]|nr:2Fe-2S ferredoxin-type domain-containing protein [Ochromonadaceae sp. CCMP2298]